METSTTAKDEIASFIASGEAGIQSSFKAATINNVLKQQYTLQGKVCPVRVLERNGETYLINREALDEVQRNGG